MGIYKRVLDLEIFLPLNIILLLGAYFVSNTFKLFDWVTLPDLTSIGIIPSLVSSKNSILDVLPCHEYSDNIPFDLSS